MKGKILLVLVLVTLFVSFIVYEAHAQLVLSRPAVPVVKRFLCAQRFEGAFYSCKNPILRFAEPEEGSYLTDVEIAAGALGPRYNKARIKNVTFEYSFDGQNWQLVEEVGPGEVGWDTQWDTSVVGLPSGPVLLRVLLRDIENVEWQDVVRININKAPVNIMDVSRDATNLILDGSRSFDPDGNLVLHSWLIDTAAPFEVNGSVVSIPISSLPIGEDFGIMLATVDDHEGAEEEHEKVKLPCVGCHPEVSNKSCGCISMDIRDTGAGDLKYPNLGPYDNIDRTQSGPYDFNHRLQVEAKLVPKSNPKRCFEGQRAKGTFREGSGQPRNVIERKELILNNDGNWSLSNGNVPCPYDGDKLCDDKYHKEHKKSKTKVYFGQEEIKWADAPGWWVSKNVPLKKRYLGNGGAEAKLGFEAWVKGPAGGCKCSWDVLLRVEINGTVSQNELKNKNCGAF